MNAPGIADVEAPTPNQGRGNLARGPEGSAVRAWLYLVALSLQRQARLRQMVWIALALLVLMATVVSLVTLGDRWTMKHWDWRWIRPGQVVVITPRTRDELRKDETGLRPDEREALANSLSGTRVFFKFSDMATSLELMPLVTQAGPSLGGSPALTLAMGLESAFAAANRVSLERTDLPIFSNWVVFTVFLGFLLPIWSLSFATEALGGERESRTLVWLLTRPLPRWSIYLAKFLAVLPWCLALNLGGFALLCLLAGRPGRTALGLYWPAILGGTVAFCALFHLMSALFRRAAVLSLVYAFFLEWVLGNMPGTMKRISISFYTRCLMFDAAEPYGLQPDRPTIYLPVSGPAAWAVLASLTAVFLLMGMVVFSRSEYQDLA